MQADSAALDLLAAVVRQKGGIELPAEGVSMQPFIREGDVCRFVPCRAAALRPGEVALFRALNGKLVAHRYIRPLQVNGERRFVFKGDANGGCDEPVGAEHIIGRLMTIRRDGIVRRADGAVNRLRAIAMVKHPRFYAYVQRLRQFRASHLVHRLAIRDAKIAFRLLYPYAIRRRGSYLALGALLLLDIGLALAFAQLYGALLDAAVHGRPAQLLRLLPAGGALLLASAASSYWSAWLDARTVNGIKQELAEDLYRHLLLLPDDPAGDLRTGDRVSPFTADIHSLDGIIGRGLLELIRLPLMYAAVLVYLMQLNGQLALLSLAVAPLALAGGAVFGLLLRRSGRSILQLWSELNSLLSETFQGLAVIRSFSQEERFLGVFARRNRELALLELGNAKLNGTFRASGYAISGAAYLICLGAGAYSIARGTMSVGALLTFLSLAHHLVDPLTGLAGRFAGFQRSAAAIERLAALFARKPESPELPQPRPGRTIRTALRIEEVTFGYADAQPLFERLQLELAAGKTTAIVGPSGAGKTTLLHLLRGSLKPQSGRICVDGTPLDAMGVSERRSLFAEVAQETFLFAGTVRENLLLARPGITEEELRQAAADASLHEFILSLPQGYDTEVGERGMRLSGGQRQRLAIARALLKDAPILLLDEPTSALDRDTERDVWQGLRRLMQGRTTLLVTHRLSLAGEADAVVTLRPGPAYGKVEWQRSGNKHDGLASRCL